MKHFIHVFFIVGYFLTWLLIPFILLVKKKPASSLAWVFTVILFPYVGPLVYFAIGPDRLRRKRIKKHQEYHTGSDRKEQESGVHVTQSLELLNALDQDARDLLLFLSEINDLPVSCSADPLLLPDAKLFYQTLCGHIEKAAHHVHIQVYVWKTDHYGEMILEALTAAAKRGVEVRVLVDEVGSIDTPEKFFKPLTEAGGQFAWFSTLHLRKQRFLVNMRNHRKVQIIDGRIGMVGGMNISREYAGESQYGDWHDAQVEVKGPVASVLQDCFAEDWYYVTEKRFESEAYYPEFADSSECLVQVIAAGPDSPQEPLHKSLLALMHHAKKRLWITAGYFAPNQLLLTGLQMCAMRGVEVKLLVPVVSDHAYLPFISRSFYEELLPYGVEIIESRKGVFHAKTAIADDCWAMVGSANFDNRSMLLNFELNLLMYNKPLVRELEEMIRDYFSHGTKIELSDHQNRPLRTKLLEAAARPFAPLC